MADYYPLISRAILALHPEAPGESRRALYERARNALIAQLRSVTPQLSESEITRERLALEEAVRKVESEAAQRARELNALSPRERKQRILQILAAQEAAQREYDRAREEARQKVEAQAREEARRKQEEADARAQEEARQSQEAETRARAETIQKQEEADAQAEASQRRPNPPPIDVIPDQDLKKAIGFSPTRRGPLDLVADPPVDPHDVEQSRLYRRIRRQLALLRENVPSQERSQINHALDDFLDDQPAEWEQVEFKKVLWLSGNDLRVLLAQHDAVRTDPEHYSKLPPSVAEGLRGPVQAWSMFVQGDPQLSEIDKYSLGPQEQQKVIDSLKVAAEVIKPTIDDGRLLTPRAANTVGDAIRSASSTSSDINTKIAQDFADRTSRNLLSQILRKAYLLYEAIVEPVSEEARALRADMVKNASHAAGGAAATAALAAGNHALPFLEFIATNPAIVKQYILIAFQNVQMNEIVDAIEFEYNRIRPYL